jgi:hypothetical protein
MGCVVSSEADSPRGGRDDDDDDYYDKQQHQHHHSAPNGAGLPALGVPAPPAARKTYDPNELARRKTAKKKRVAIAVETLMSSADVRVVPKSDKTTRWGEGDVQVEIECS